MKLLIDDVRLKLLLEQKKHFIGRRVAWDSVLSAVSFLISVLCASYQTILCIPGIVLKTVFVMAGIGFTIKSIIDLREGLRDRYSYQDLLADIDRLNEMTHDHSIIVIRDTFREFPNRYLVYDDVSWECMLFPNYKDSGNGEAFIRDHLSAELKIKAEDIQLSFVAQRVHQKHSVSAGADKLYSHKFYLATISTFPDNVKDDTFVSDGRTYHWKTMTELELDEQVREKNADIVNYIKAIF